MSTWRAEDTPVVLSTMDFRLVTWSRKIFLGLAAIGLLVCMFVCAEAMLFWMPDSWGTIGESGDFQTVRSGLAGMIALFAGCTLIGLIDQASEDRLFLRLAHVTLHGERMIDAAASPTRLDDLKRGYQEASVSGSP